MMGHTNLSGPTDNLHRRMLHKKGTARSTKPERPHHYPANSMARNTAGLQKKAIVTIAENATPCTPLPTTPSTLPKSCQNAPSLPQKKDHRSPNNPQTTWAATAFHPWISPWYPPKSAPRKTDVLRFSTPNGTSLLHSLQRNGWDSILCFSSSTI